MSQAGANSTSGGGGGSGINTINSIGPSAGNFTIAAGSNITITPGANQISIASTGGTTTHYPFAVVTATDGLNVTGDGTFWYLSTVGAATLSILYDVGSNVDIGTGTAVFTAPATGIYYFNWDYCLAAIGVTHTKIDVYIEVNNVDSYLGNIFNPYPISTAGVLAQNSSCQISLNIGDTVRAKLAVYNGAKTVSVYGSTTTEFARCTFSGFLIQ